jgi:hypothetical protein
VSDTSQGEGWWEASDGKWYAPELHPDYVAPAPEPEPAPAPEPEPSEVVAPTEPPPIPPIEPPPVGGPPPIPPPPLVLPGDAVADGGDGASGKGKGKLIAAIIVIVLLIGGGIAVAVSRNDDDSSSAKSDQSSSASDTSSSTDSTDSTAGSDSAGASDTKALIAKANASLLTVDDLSSDFQEVTPGDPAPLPCTSNKVADLVDADGHAQVQLDDAAENISVSENIYVYQSVDVATTAYDGIKSGLDCASGNIGSGSDETLLVFDDPPSSAGFGASDDDFKVAGTISSSTDPNLHRQPTSTTLNSSATDFATDQSSSSSSGPLAYFEAYVSRVGQSVLTFTFLYTPDSETTGLDQPDAISEKGVNRFAN